ncbi:MAG: carboxy terminal-processing peptidase [Paludisphaera borealis]|uniref:carboxy terminal-processing peptidase n=1 Tax=Paludisphaera borealis TaxID=1387353 RepID=UPI00283F6222|nr:carboxy terminal-processing peptidase [Paludisphaera borealis]MDR3618930.1 carboxy terminal-processing peptidase [Paludisphaera borealis]
MVDLLEQGHMARPVIDDEIAVKWCDNFIKDLDPQKYYFLKADVEEFRKQAKTLDDKIHEGNIDFARVVFDRFLQRHDERYKTVMDLLGKKLDFTVDEFLTDDPDKIDFPADKAEADERWRKKLKYETLQLRADDTTEDEVVKKLTIRYRDRNRIFHQFDSNELLEVYLSSLTRTFDPHSSYLSAKNLEDMLNQQLHLSLEGIGASLRSEDGYAVVAEVVPGMAADKDGRLQPDDKIVGILKDDNKSEIDLVEKKLSDVVRYIRGPRGTKVKLIVLPSGSKERKVYEITRERVELTEQHAKGKVIESKLNGKDVKLGVISLPAFYGDTMAILRGDPNAVSATADCRKILNEFKKVGVDAVVVDLRDNGGGLLEEAKTLSGLFIDTGPVVQIKEVFGVKHLDDDDEGTAWDGPLVVLINKLSASASEIFAGVIRDYSRGLIIGDSSTFGKGTVQSIVNIGEHTARRDRGKNRGALKLTIQQFYRANGDSTQINGVAPHIHLPSIRDFMDFGEGKMDNALKFEKVAPLAHDNYNRTPDDLVAALTAKSAERRKNDPKFKKLDERIKQFVDRKARHSIPLNEAKFKAEYLPDDEEKAADEKEKKDKRAKKKFTEREVWASDFYNDEVVRIIGDYLALGSKVLAAAPVRAVVADQ